MVLFFTNLLTGYRHVNWRYTECCLSIGWPDLTNGIILLISGGPFDPAGIGPFDYDPNDDIPFNGV